MGPHLGQVARDLELDGSSGGGNQKLLALDAPACGAGDFEHAFAESEGQLDDAELGARADGEGVGELDLSAHADGSGELEHGGFQVGRFTAALVEVDGRGGEA
jgi:hypothetical protein